jgi:hypothetical protein
MMVGHDAPSFDAYEGTIDPSSTMNNTNFEFSDKTMENDFDFDSAASSPSPFGIGPVEMESPEMPTIKHDTPMKSSQALKNKMKNHNKANSVKLILTILQELLRLTPL